MSLNFFRNCFRLSSVALVAMSLGACNFLPASGPYSADVTAPALQNTDGVDFKLVTMNADVVRVLAEQDALGLSGTFTNKRRGIPDVRIGVGDVLSVSIFEAQAGGLFIPQEAASRAGNFVDLPAQAVDIHGNISVPYAGQIRAAGLLPSQVERDIIEKLRNRAIEPQAVVTVKEQRANSVTVLGEVNAPIKFPLTPVGERVLDAVSRAGATPAKGYDMFVTLQRGGRDATVSFTRLVRDPANNVYLQPGDTLYIHSRARTFLAFGASGKQGQFPFGDDSISLSEAVAKAQGLNDAQADPQSIYMFRVETRETLRRMGVDVTNLPDGKVPTIYVVNLRDPTGFLLSTKVPMRDKDIIYIANASSVELAKFLALVLPGAVSFREIAEGAALLKNNF